MSENKNFRSRDDLVEWVRERYPHTFGYMSSNDDEYEHHPVYWQQIPEAHDPNSEHYTPSDLPCKRCEFEEWLANV